MTAKPKVLFFVPTLLVGGAEQHTVQLCLRLRQRGFSARILVHQPSVSPVMAGHPAGADAVVLGLKGMSDPKGWLTIWHTLRRERPDVIVAVNQTPLIIAVLERRMLATSAKIVCVLHTTDLQPYEKYQERALIWLAPFTDLLVYVGANQQKVWEARGLRPRRTALIRNGVDTARFAAGILQRAESRASLGVEQDDYLLGILASFRPEKNHGDLIAALARSREAGTRVRLLCIGDGGTRSVVERQAYDLGVADAVIFAGEQSDVPSWLSACDAGVLCSTIETFPLSAIEFLATGVPMIGANIGGISEIVVEGGNGVLYPSGDVVRLAAAITELADPARRGSLAANAQESVAALSVDRMVDRYAEAFEALCC